MTASSPTYKSLLIAAPPRTVRAPPVPTPEEFVVSTTEIYPDRKGI
jgi:hypothetical protein